MQWVFLLNGGVGSIAVFGPIRWCVWSFRPSSPLQLPRLQFFVCLFAMQASRSDICHTALPRATGGFDMRLECGAKGRAVLLYVAL